jgi:hypothetical protein
MPAGEAGMKAREDQKRESPSLHERLKVLATRAREHIQPLRKLDKRAAMPKTVASKAALDLERWLNSPGLRRPN